MADKTARYRQLLQQPQVRALLNTISYAEGTPGEAGYRTKFGGGKFSDLSRHPDQVVKSGRYSSAAAGKYQFLPGTWQGVANELGLKRFGPEEQDIAALRLIERRGALDPFLKGAKFGVVMDKLAPEWASLPTAAGQSYYGQPVKSLGDLYKFYEEQKKLAVPTQTVAAAPQGADQRSVEDILSSSLGLGQKPGLDGANEKSQGLVNALKRSLLGSVLSTIANPTSLIGLP
jgi:muramidase (phage lysozyme)